MKSFTTSVRSTRNALVPALAALALSATVGAGASANPVVRPGHRPVQTGPRTLRYDLGGAQAKGSLSSGGFVEPVEGEFIENGDGSLSIIIPGFDLELGHGEGLTARANIRAAIPVDVIDGRRPGSIKARANLSFFKERGASVSASLRTALLGEGSEPSDKTWSDFNSIIHRTILENVAPTTRACQGDSKGVLTVDFALSAERVSTNVDVRAGGVDGRSFIIDVIPGAAVRCSDAGR